MTRTHAGSIATAVGALGATLLIGACGASQGAGTPGNSQTATAARASLSPTASAAPAPIPPLLAYDTANHAVLYTSGGVQSATLPANSPFQVISPLGDRLLAEHSNGKAVDGLSAINAAGTTQQLEHFTTPSDFIDAIGARDGHAWAWILNNAIGGCGGSGETAPTNDVYISSVPGQGALLAHLPALANKNDWNFYAWTKAGIVLREGGPPGCYEGPRFNDKPTDLLDPATGDVSSLATRMGSGCMLQDIADDGTLACMPLSNGGANQPSSVSSLVLRIVRPDGTRHDLTAATFLQSCSAGSAVFGDVSISDDGRHVSLTRWCQPSATGNPSITTWVIDARTSAATKADVDALGAVAWLPGPPVLIARQNTFTGSAQSSYAVAVDGSATKLVSALVAEQCLRHF